MELASRFLGMCRLVLLAVWGNALWAWGRDDLNPRAIYHNLGAPSASVFYGLLFAPLFLMILNLVRYRGYMRLRVGKHTQEQQSKLGLSCVAATISFFFLACSALLSRLQVFFVFFFIGLCLAGFRFFRAVSSIVVVLCHVFNERRAVCEMCLN